MQSEISWSITCTGAASPFFISGAGAGSTPTTLKHRWDATANAGDGDDAQIKHERGFVERFKKTEDQTNTSQPRVLGVGLEANQRHADQRYDQTHVHH